MKTADNALVSDSTIPTWSSVVPAWINLKLLATLASGYMFLMSVVSPESTVFKKYAHFEGQQFQGILLLASILALFIYKISGNVPPQKQADTDKDQSIGANSSNSGVTRSPGH